ncbi:MAG: hypothetical protein AB7U85_09125 [Alphaproteobacteria bacterium]
MPKLNSRNLLKLLILCCFICVASSLAFASEDDGSYQVAQTTFKRKTSTTAEDDSKNSTTDAYAQKRAAREEARKAREEARKARAEERESRRLRSSNRNDDKTDETAQVQKPEEPPKRGEAFNLESLGKNAEKVLSLGAVRDIMVGRLELMRNERFIIGMVFEIDDSNAAVEIKTTEGALVQYIVVDRTTGDTFFALPDYKPSEVKYDPNAFGKTTEEAQNMLQRFNEFENLIELRFGSIKNLIESGQYKKENIPENNVIDPATGLPTKIGENPIDPETIKLPEEPEEGEVSSDGEAPAR